MHSSRGLSKPEMLFSLKISRQIHWIYSNDKLTRSNDSDVHSITVWCTLCKYVFCSFIYICTEPCTDFTADDHGNWTSNSSTLSHCLSATVCIQRLITPPRARFTKYLTIYHNILSHDRLTTVTYYVPSKLVNEHYLRQSHEFASESYL